MTITTITRHRCITTKLLLLFLLLTTGAGEVWGATETKYSRSGVGEGATEWKASDLTDWTANTAGSTFEINGGLKTGGGNASYEYQKALEIDPAGKLTITGTWNTGSSLGRDAAYNYLQFGTVELRAYGQGRRGTIVINGEETELTTTQSDVRDDADWTFSITIIQATGAVSYTITPPSGAKNGTGNAGVLDFSAIKMGYLKTGQLSSTHQTLKAISITQELYAYTVKATGTLDQTIASGSDGPSASLTIPYHHYILDGTTLHVAARQGSSPHYGKSFTLSSNNQEETITYASRATNVAVFKEAEDFLTPVINNNYVYIRCSGTEGGYATTYADVADLAGGAYVITAASYGRPTNFIFRTDNNELWTHSATAWGENNSGTVQFTGGTLQVQGGSNNNPLDYVYVQRVFAFEDASSDRNMASSTTGKPTLVNTLEGYTVTYSSSNTQIATVNGTGDITFLHNGTAVITATATKADSPTYTTTHTVNITGETNATETWDISVSNQETYTLSGTGYVGQTAEGTLITMHYGKDSESETQTVSSDNAHCIDANGFWHAHLSGDATGIPDMGTYYAFTPKVNGTLTINALSSVDGDKGQNGIRLVDSDGNVLESKTTINASYADYAFGTLLIAGRTYYVYAETDLMTGRLNTAYSTLWLHSFTFTQMEGTTISLIDQSLLFTTETNSNRKQLDRTIPGFNLEFGGGDGAKYTGGGIFVLRNASETNNDESQNGKITITPRFASGSTFAITGVTLNIGSKAENAENSPATNPTISVNGVEKSVSANSNISWSSSDLSSADNTKLVILLKGSTSSSTKNKIQVYLNSITFNYSTTSTTLDNTKGTIDLRSAASTTYLYGYEGDEKSNDTYFYSPHAFNGDVSFNYEGDGFGQATNTVKKLLDSNNVSGLTGNSSEVEGLIHFGENDTYTDGKLSTYDKYKVRIGSGVGKLTASFAATDNFAASSATTRLYSRDYVETDVVLASNAEYTVPAASGLSFKVTTSGGSISLTGTDATPSTALTNDQVFSTTANATSVTIKNTGDADITIKKIEVSRKKPTLDFGYIGAVGADANVLFLGSSYTPNAFTITDEKGETDLSSYYATTTTGTYAITYAITQAVAGVSINPSTGVLTVDSEADDGILKVTLTVNPLDANKADYAPITKTLELKVVDGVWDFRTYSLDEHRTMYNSDGWSGSYSGWYASRDNAEFEDIIRYDGTPLPRALALQTMGKHRLLHTNHGYLHLQGKGIGGTESANGGGQLRIPVKADMLVEINSYSGDLLSEMEIDGVTDIEGNDVTMFYVNPSPASQYFIAKSDGYIIVRNPSTNLDLHICYINVSADMAFKYGEEDESGNIITYVDAGAGKWTNPVMNQGTTTIAYSFENTTSDPVSEIDPATGEVTLRGAYGQFTGTATGSGTGLLAGKTRSYIANVIGLNFKNASHNLGDANANTFDLISSECIESCKNTSGADDDGTLKSKIVFSLVDASPSVTLSGSTLTIGEVGTVTVKATLGAIEKTFTCTLNGGTLADGLNPVIANDATSYTITLSGGTTHKFKLKDMYDAILGDLKTSKSSLVFKNVDDAENPVTLDVSSTVVSCSKLLIEGFSTIKKGGVIPIYASYEYNSSTYNIEGTLTVAYTSHVWRFQHNLLTGMDSAGEDAEEAADHLADDALAGYGSAHGLTGGLAQWKTNDDAGSYTTKTNTWGTGATIDEPVDAETNHSDSHDWKFVRKIGGHTESPIIYYYNHAVEGQNALVIPETEGLQLFASPSNKQLGVSMAQDEAPYDCRNLMLLRGGKLTIPLLKKGQWVEVRWTRHKEEMGERILMTNLSDVDGTAITSTYKIGNCFYNLPWSTSTYMFQATADGDVTFEVADNIYVSIQEIILHDPDKDVWPFKSSISTTLKGYDDLHVPTVEQRATWSEKDDLSDFPNVDWVYLWNDDAASHTLTFLTKDFQNAPNAPQKWTFELDDMLKREGAVMTTTGVDNGEATLTYNGGWGKAKVTMTCYSQNMKYVANKKTWTLTFGQAPKQTYPYTWDFTKFFASTLGSTTNENSWAAVAYAGSTTSTTNPLRIALYNNHTVSNYGAGGYANTYNTDDYQSYYVEGGQLVSYGLRNTNNGIVPETAGLGFILDVDGDANNQPDQNMLMLNMTNNITSAQQAVNGQTWITDTGDNDAEKHTDNSHLTIGSGGKVIVPKPNDEVNYANYYIYIKSSHKPTATTNVNDCSSDAEVPTPTEGNNYNKVYKYQFSANEDAVFTFTSSDEATDGQLHSYIDPVGDRKYTDIYAIAVTKDYKTVKRLNGVGWATESRDYDVDYSLDSLLTTRPLQAYSVIARSSNPIYSVNKDKTTVRLQDRNYVVPDRQGLVLKQVTDSPGANGSTYTVPLFVPAVTTATEPDYTFTNNLMRPKLDERAFTTECENADGTDNGSGEYTRFILSEKYMTWRKEGDAAASYDTQFTSGTVPGFYRLHIYGDIDYDDTATGGFDHLTGSNRNTLGANKAYLVLPSDKINSPIWQASAPARASYFIGIEDVSDMEEITEVTEAPANNATYNLSGQRVADDSTLSPGIYIINGRKVIVK